MTNTRGELLPGTVLFVSPTLASCRQALERLVEPRSIGQNEIANLMEGRLWAEVLNLGAFDVIVKPFDEQDVLHVLAVARIYKKFRTRSRQSAMSQRPADGRIAGVPDYPHDFAALPSSSCRG